MAHRGVLSWLIGAIVPSLNGGALAGQRNVLLNGDGRVAQRGTTFTAATVPLNSDDTYLLDRWILLSDGNDIVDVSQETTVVPTGAWSAFKFDIETANKKFGWFQPIERRNCAHLIGATATWSFEARKGASNATAGTLRAALVSWQGTEDAVTSDLISAWNAAGANPTLAANWTYETTPADLVLTDSFQKFSATGAVDTASSKNVGWLFWLDDADATVGDLIYTGNHQVENGPIATVFEQRKYADEIASCQYYAEWLGGDADVYEVFGNGGATSSTAAVIVSKYVRKRVRPTVTVTGSYVVLDGGGGVVTVTGISAGATNVGLTMVKLDITVAAGLTAGQGAPLFAENNTTSRIKIEAEM